MTIQKGSLIREQATTGGTADFTLPNVGEDGFRSFADVFTPGATCVVAYTAYDPATGQFERGLGLLSSATTLERPDTEVGENSNGDNAKVNFTNPPLIYCDAAEAGGLIGRNRWNTNAHPTESVGWQSSFGEGSLWSCAVALTHSPGNNFQALWMMQAAGNGAQPRWFPIGGLVAFMGDIDGAVNNYTSLSYGMQDDYSDDVVNTHGFGCGGIATAHGALLLGLGLNEDYLYGAHQTLRAGMVKTTADDTPVKLMNRAGWKNEAEGPEHRDHIPIGESSSVLYSGHLVGHIEGGTSRFYELTFAVQRDGTGDPVIVGSPTVTALFGTTGTAPSIGIDTTADGFYVTVTGAAATDTRWTFAYDEVTAGLGYW